MSKLLKCVLAATAFGPVLLVYAMVSLMNGNYCSAVIFLALCILLVLICDGLMQFGMRYLSTRSYTTATIETADSEVFSFLLVYLLPLITRDLATYNWVAWILVTSMFCLVVATSYGFHFNPLLVLLGHHFYKVTEKDGIPHTLIAKRRFYRSRETLCVGRIADYVLIEKKPNS